MTSRRRRFSQTAAVAALVIGALATLNGYRPVKKGYLSVPSFIAGMLVTELPLQTMAAQAAAIGATWRAQSPHMRWLSATVPALCSVGLLGLNRIGRQANVPLGAALDEGLGSGRVTKSGSSVKAPGVFRTMRIWHEYAHDADIAYGEHGTANHLDVWSGAGANPDAPAPVLLQIHGGAWSSGNKRGQAHPLMSHLVEHGWVCVSINYRLSPRNTWPDAIVDVKRAIAWVKANIERFGGDSDFIAITGGSAGGHLSALAALTANDPSFQPGFEDVDTTVQAAVPFYGVYDFTRSDGVLHPMMVPFLEKGVMKRLLADAPELFAAASPITHVSADAPPFFVLHGSNDSFIPVEQARAFAARLRVLSNSPVVYAELPIAQHAFDVFGSARAKHAAVAVEQFLDEVRLKWRRD